MGECTLGIICGRATNNTGKDINVVISGEIIPIGQGKTFPGKDVDGIILDGKQQWKLPDGKIINGNDSPKDILKFNNAQNVTVTKNGTIFEISISPAGNGDYLEDGTPVVFKDWARKA